MRRARERRRASARASAAIVPRPTARRQARRRGKLTRGPDGDRLCRVTPAAPASPSAEPAPARDAPAPKKRPKKKRKRFSFLRFLVLLFLFGSAFAGALGYWGYREFEKDLPDRWSALIDYHPSRASRVYSADGELIGEFFLEKRVVVPYEKIPTHVTRAFVAAEDNRFFEHHGVDPMGILRASFANLKAGRVVQGGSTITQQVAKLMLVGGERKLERKIREAILAH